MKIKLKYVVHTGREYWAFTKKPKVTLKNHEIQFKVRGGTQINITSAWEMFYDRDYLYSGLIYRTNNLAKSFIAFPTVLKIAYDNYLAEMEGENAKL